MGGLFFSHFGDRLGRKSVMVATLFLMRIATFAVGLLPTYNQVGIWAPILLVLCRFLHGFGAGAEQALGVVLLNETWAKGNEGSTPRWCSWAPRPQLDKTFVARVSLTGALWACISAVTAGALNDRLGRKPVALECSALVSWATGHWWHVAVYMMFMMAITSAARCASHPKPVIATCGWERTHTDESFFCADHRL